MQVEQEVACCSKACLLVAQAHIYYSTQRAMFGKCIAYNDGATVEVSWLLLRGKKASPFTGLRPSFPLSFHPSVVVHPLVQYQPMALCRTLWHTLVFEYHETAKYSRWCFVIWLGPSVFPFVFPSLCCHPNLSAVSVDGTKPHIVAHSCLEMLKNCQISK